MIESFQESIYQENITFLNEYELSNKVSNKKTTHKKTKNNQTQKQKLTELTGERDESTITVGDDNSACIDD